MPCFSEICLFMLAWSSPCLAFIAANAVWFNKKQILGSLGLSFILGWLNAIGFSFLPGYAAASFAGLIFGVLSERFLAAFAKTLLERIGIILIISACFFGLYLLGGFWLLCALLFIYCLFSIWDLRKNLQKPKQTAPKPAMPGTREITYSAENTPGKLFKTPSIYLFFLESIQSHEAVASLYGHKNKEWQEYLDNRGFSTFKHAYSNEFGTTFSLNTILGMDAQSYSPSSQAPPVFQWLKANGYQIRLYDCALYTFSHYVPFVDYFNFAIPSWIKSLYSWLLPFFAQSSIINAITGNVDYFTASADYKKVLADYLNSPDCGKQPQCSIFRFGAQHACNTITLSDRHNFVQYYTKLYDQSVQDAMNMIDIVLEKDHEASIIAMGDHGAASYLGSWRGLQNVNENMRAKGLEPAIVARDLAEVLLALKIPGAKDLPISEPITLANLFWLLFTQFGADKLVARTPDNSWLHDSQLPHPFMIIKDGQPLENWIEWTPQVKLANKKTGPVNSPEDVIEIASLMRNAGQFEEARHFLEKAIVQFGFHPKLHYALANLYLAMGKPKDVLNLLEKHFTEDCYLFTSWVLALNISGKHDQAVKLLTEERNNITRLDFELVYLWLQLGVCNLQEALPLFRKKAEKSYDEIWMKEYNIRLYLHCLSALGRRQEALQYLERFISASQRHDSVVLGSLHVAAVLSLQNQQYDRAMHWFARLGIQIGKPWPAQLYLWQAGALEQLRDIEKARNLLVEMTENCSPTPFLSSQLALFDIRHNFCNQNTGDAQKTGHELRSLYQDYRQFIDEDFIRSQYGELLEKSGMTPFNFFVHYNRVLSLDPNDLFNSGYYLLSNKDIYKGGYDPVIHFLTCPPYENRKPSMKFNIQAYRARHPEIDWARQNPLMCYLQIR